MYYALTFILLFLVMLFYVYLFLQGFNSLEVYVNLCLLGNPKYEDLVMKPQHTSYFRIYFLVMILVGYTFAVYRSNTFKFSYLKLHLSGSMLHNGSLFCNIFSQTCDECANPLSKCNIVPRFSSSISSALSVNGFTYCRLFTVPYMMTCLYSLFCAVSSDF